MMSDAGEIQRCRPDPSTPIAKTDDLLIVFERHPKEEVVRRRGASSFAGYPGLSRSKARSRKGQSRDGVVDGLSGGRYRCHSVPIQHLQLATIAEGSMFVSIGSASFTQAWRSMRRSDSIASTHMTWVTCLLRRAVLLFFRRSENGVYTHDTIEMDCSAFVYLICFMLQSITHD